LRCRKLSGVAALYFRLLAGWVGAYHAEVIVRLQAGMTNPGGQYQYIAWVKHQLLAVRATQSRFGLALKNA
jgi:hypothetical protein